MNTSAEQKVNVTENSLMKQTKKQLIDIILRKDETERTLSKRVKDASKDVIKLQDEINRLSNANTILKSNYAELMNNANAKEDLALSYSGKYYDVLKASKVYKTLTVFLSVILFIMLFIFYWYC